MEAEMRLILFGASTRAAAGSALRAGLHAWCADLYADTDLRALCPVVRLSLDRYPREFLCILEQAPPGPWMYTGALENRPKLVRQLAQIRPLWGNNADVLSVVRSPITLRGILRAAGL